MAAERVGHLVVDGTPIPIDLDLGSGRVEITIDGHVAFIGLHGRGSVLALIHTEVPPALRGKGVADALARTALDHARRHGMTVKPFCPFVARFIGRHPEFQDLVDPAFTPVEAPGQTP